jgi:tetratricopeptide (TPR) repeat protein
MRSVLSLHPDDAAARWYLGFALIANGQSTEAIPVLEQAVALTDRLPGAIGVLIRAYAHAGRRPEALRLLAELKWRNEAGYVPNRRFCECIFGTRLARTWLPGAVEHPTGPQGTSLL